MPIDPAQQPQGEPVVRTGGTVAFLSTPADLPTGALAATFLTRWGTFTEASLKPGWVLIGRVRMLGPWFDGDEVDLVVAARHVTAGAIVSGDLVVTEMADAEGIPPDAPFANPQGYCRGVGGGLLPLNSVTLLADQLTGEYAEIEKQSWTIPGGAAIQTVVSVAQRDAVVLKRDYYDDPSWPDDVMYRKHQTIRFGHEEPAGGHVLVYTRSVINWAEGDVETRSRAGGDSIYQRVSLGVSDALPTPDKPTITGEPTRWVNPATVWQADVTYRGGLAGALTKLVWKRTVGAVVDYWNQSTQLWQPGVFENARSDPWQQFPAGAFPADGQYELRVAARGTVGDLSEYSEPVIVDTHPAPTATLTITPYDVPTETTSDLSPLITVTGIPAAGQDLVGWQGEVLTGTGARWAWLESTSMTGVLVTPPLPNGSTGWSVRARSLQTGGAVSPWVTLDLNVTAVTPGQPAVTVTPSTHGTSGLPIQRLTVDLPWETDGFDYVTNPLTLDIDRRVYDADSEWVRAGSVTPTPGWASNIVLDDEAPSHVPVLYRVRARSTTQYGGELVGAWSAVTPGYPIDDGAWLSAHGFPELAVRVDMVTADEGKIVSGQSGTTVIGAPHQVVTGVASVTGDGGYVARTDTPEDEAALVSLLAGAHLLTLSMTPERDSWGDTHAVPRRWFRTVGEIGVARVAQGPWTLRLVSWTATPQAAPTTVAGS